MQLLYPNPPGTVRELAYKALNMELLRHAPDRVQSLTTQSIAFGHVPDLHKCYIIDTDALVKKKDLKAAKLVSWHDIVVIAGVAHGIEIIQEGDTGLWFVTRGTMVDQQLAILTELSNKRGEKRCEVRALSIRSIIPMSFWLKSRTAKGDRIVPVISFVHHIRSGVLYQPTPFFNGIRSAAKHIAEISRDTAPAQTPALTLDRLSQHVVGKRRVPQKKRIPPGGNGST